MYSRLLNDVTASVPEVVELDAAAARTGARDGRGRFAQLRTDRHAGQVLLRAAKREPGDDLVYKLEGLPTRTWRVELHVLLLKGQDAVPLRAHADAAPGDTVRLELQRR